MSTVAQIIQSANNLNLNAVLSEVLQLLPIVLPVVIGFIAVRKGISFLIGSLRRA